MKNTILPYTIGSKLKITKSASGNPYGSITTIVGYAYWNAQGSYYEYTAERKLTTYNNFWYICRSVIDGTNNNIPSAFKPGWHEYPTGNLLISDVNNFKIL